VAKLQQITTKGKYGGLLAKARKQADAEFWKPTKPGEEIAGEIVAINTGGQFNSTFYHISTESDGVLIVAASPTTVLGKKLADLDVEIGDFLAIVFLGEVTTRDGRHAKTWSCASQKLLITRDPLPPPDDDFPH